MTSSQNSEGASLSLPTLQIDFRCGNVVMLLGTEKYQAELPMSKADCSQINTAGGTVQMWEKLVSEPLPVAEG